MDRLILSDLDFTLLRSDLSINSFTRETWNNCTSKAKLSIATARSYTGIKDLLKGLILKEPLILLDGTIIASPDGDILHMSAIDKSLGDEVLYIAQKSVGLYPLIVAWESEEEQFFYPKDPSFYQQELLKGIHNKKRIFANKELRAKNNNLKIVFLSSQEEAHILVRALDSALGQQIEIKSAKDPYMDCYFTTILHPMGDKAHALAKLEELEGIDIAHTTVFGDNHNDIGMFKLAGTKIAVANAIDGLKELADIILPHTNDEDAVARYLNDKVCRA